MQSITIRAETREYNNCRHYSNDITYILLCIIIITFVQERNNPIEGTFRYNNIISINTLFVQLLLLLLFNRPLTNAHRNAHTH